MSAWSKTKRSCLNSVARERSLFFEFMVLQREVRLTGNPILGKLGPRSALWEEKPKLGSCYRVDSGQSSEKMSATAISREGKSATP
jgi:hypothetical protein